MDANIVRPASMDSEALGQYIADQTAGVLRRLEDLRPFYEELWKRFDKLPKGQKILGCQTRSEYCEKILHRSIRSVQYTLRGPRKRQITQKEVDFEQPLRPSDATEVCDFVPKEIVEADEEREEREAEEAARRQDAKDKQKYEKLKTKKDLSKEELEFVNDYEFSRYDDLTEIEFTRNPPYCLHRPKKNLTDEELKFVLDYETRAAERRAKRAEEQKQEDIKRIREKAEREEREGFEFDPTGTLEDFLSPLRRRVVSANVHAFLIEIVKEGFRQAAAKHHPDKGGSQQQMQDLNEANTLLKGFVRSVKTNEQRRAAA